LLDTVVISEFRKTKPNVKVSHYLQQYAPEMVFMSVMTLGEIELGIQQQKIINPTFAMQLNQWLDKIHVVFGERILMVTPPVARRWAMLCNQIGNKSIDNLIAATALHHNLTVITRNVKHFEPLGVRCFDPF
jgi:toxin FitB